MVCQQLHCLGKPHNAGEIFRSAPHSPLLTAAKEQRLQFMGRAEKGKTDPFGSMDFVARKSHRRDSLGNCEELFAQKSYSIDEKEDSFALSKGGKRLHLYFHPRFAIGGAQRKHPCLREDRRFNLFQRDRSSWASFQIGHSDSPLLQELGRLEKSCMFHLGCNEMALGQVREKTL